MNNFIFDELAAREYRNERRAEAKAHNELVRAGVKKPAPKFYCALGNLFKKLAQGLKNRHTSPAMNEQKAR